MFETLTLEFTSQLATLAILTGWKNATRSPNAWSPKFSHAGRSGDTVAPACLSSPAREKSFCAGMDLEMLSAIATQSSADNMEEIRGAWRKCFAACGVFPNR